MWYKHALYCSELQNCLQNWLYHSQSPTFREQAWKQPPASARNRKSHWILGIFFFCKYLWHRMKFNSSWSSIRKGILLPTITNEKNKTIIMFYCNKICEFFSQNTLFHRVYPPFRGTRWYSTYDEMGWGGWQGHHDVVFSQCPRIVRNCYLLGKGEAFASWQPCTNCVWSLAVRLWFGYRGDGGSRSQPVSVFWFLSLPSISVFLFCVFSLHM